MICINKRSTSFKTHLILFNFNVWGGLGIKPYEKLKQALKQHLSMHESMYEIFVLF